MGEADTAQKDMKIHIRGIVEREVKNEKVDAGLDEQARKSHRLRVHFHSGVGQAHRIS